MRMTKKKSAVPDILYSREVEAFLRSFVHEPDPRGLHNPPQSVDEVIQDLRDLWRKTDRFFRPEEIRKLLMKKYLSRKTDPNVFDFVETVERERYNNKDPLTGYMRKTELGPISGLAHLYALEGGQDMAVMDVDFSNMGGTNHFFQDLLAKSEGIAFENADVKRAEGLTDQAAKCVAQIILKCLQEKCGNNATILPVRSGGDELRIVFNGVDQDDFKELSAYIHEEIEQAMARLGLHDHPHMKAPNDRLKNGFGAAISVMNMKDVEAATYTECADAKIEVEKRILGSVRAGVLPHPGLMLKMAFENRLPEGGGKLAQDALMEEITERRNSYRSAMKKAGTSPEDIAKDPAQALADIEMQMDLVLWGMGEHKRSQGYFSDVWKKRALDRSVEYYASLEERNELKLLKMTGDLNLTLDTYELSLIIDPLMGLTPKDPATGFSMARDFPETLDIYMGDVTRHREELSTLFWDETPEADRLHEALDEAGMDVDDLGKLGPQMLGVSFHNLAGLNKAFGHDNADKALRFMGEMLKKTLNVHGLLEDDYVAVHHGGGEFSVLMKPVIERQNGTLSIPSEALLNDIEKSLADQLDQLNTMGIDEFIERLDIALTDDSYLKENGVQAVRDIPDAKGRAFVDGLHVSTTTKDMGKVNWEQGNSRAGQYIGALRSDLEQSVETLRLEREAKHNAANDDLPKPARKAPVNKKSGP